MILDKIVFRCDANKVSGFGHFKRCMQVAALLNCEPIFFGDYNNTALTILNSNRLKYVKTSEFNSQQIKILKGILEDNIHLIIVDSYLADKNYYENLNKHKLKWGVFDDYNNYNYEGSEFVLNFRLNAEKIYTYITKHSMLGVDYMPVEDSLTKLRTVNETTDINDEIQNILVFIGSSDIYEISLSLASAINECYPNIKIDIILGDDHYHKLREINFPYIGIHRMRSDVDKLMMHADLIISGGGKFKYESCYSLTPTMVYSQTEGEYDDSIMFSKNKLIIDCGLAKDFNKDILLTKLGVYSNRYERNKLKMNCLNTFNKNGNQNIINKINSIL